LKGVIVKFNESKGFGFINCDEGNVFFHISDIKNKQDIIEQGLSVNFDITSTEKGKKAINIHVSYSVKNFITIGQQRIKRSNIKEYYIGLDMRQFLRDNSDKPTKHLTCVYRRKIWFTDYIMEKAYKPNLATSKLNLDSKSFEKFDDSSAWDKYINFVDLKKEYEKVKRDYNRKINEVLANQEAVLEEYKVYYSGIKEWSRYAETYYPALDRWSSGTEWGFNHVFLTRGRLYFDGTVLRCEGSPFSVILRYEKDILYDQMCPIWSSEDRKYYIKGNMHNDLLLLYNEEEAIKSTELTKITYDEKDYEKELEALEKRKPEEKRCLYVTTYQNEQFKFREDTYDIMTITLSQ